MVDFFLIPRLEGGVLERFQSAVPARSLCHWATLLEFEFLLRCEFAILVQQTKLLPGLVPRPLAGRVALPLLHLLLEQLVVFRLLFGRRALPNLIVLELRLPFLGRPYGDSVSVLLLANPRESCVVLLRVVLFQKLHELPQSVASLRPGLLPISRTGSIHYLLYHAELRDRTRLVGGVDGVVSHLGQRRWNMGYGATQHVSNACCTVEDGNRLHSQLHHR